MKKIAVILSLALAITTISCSQAPADKGKKGSGIITFADTIHDFQNIEQFSEATYTFIFKNTGKANIVISNVRTSCGCTTPDWTREPIKKNKPGAVKVSYNTGILGSFHKTIDVFQIHRIHRLL